MKKFPPKFLSVSSMPKFCVGFFFLKKVDRYSSVAGATFINMWKKMSSSFRVTLDETILCRVASWKVSNFYVYLFRLEIEIVPASKKKR